ncbi:type II toxin-antitoxin system HipA family toxin [Luteibacter aegosomaticola]|uniref:type II toxin-antitoxin system HipA family toxin n=1 Tax=Luteibacter aegosomaticola TaxID=2911538 RepID=UPI001FF7646B|nr:type II toxin-antitoxin system HipA family toxin [Luteibacter aegosomaticola]UPG91044.1 type II toxin-antitoxin system HipA family toxin [Luteibacter aegosomaticola]
MALVVLLRDSTVGHLSTDREGHAHFAYDEAWRQRDDAIPLSLSLPLASREHAWRTVEAVIWGLLPDNERVLQSWGRQFHVSPRNAVALLSHVGEDCAGAVQFIPTARLDAVLEGRQDGIHWLTESELAERLRLLRDDAGAMRRSTDQGQFSLPGAQPKMALLGQDGQWGIPSGRIPTTHILKPPTGAYLGYAQNEHFCLQLATAVGFRTCRSSILRAEDELAICVERYDRNFVGGRWQRLHQEDMCQALGVRPEAKYQNEGGPSPQDIDHLLRNYSVEQDEDRLAFFSALVFNWLIGGSDAHAKNYSLLLGAQQTARLAPLYDISSSLPYPTINRRKMKLAMKIGSAYRWHDIRLADWINQADLMGVDEEECRAILEGVAEGLPDLASQVAQAVAQDDMHHPVVDRMVDEIAASSATCAKMLIGAALSQT